jgi:hypothetical protein
MQTYAKPDSVQVLSAASLLDGDDEEHEERKRESYIQRKYGGYLGLFLGSQTRFLVGVGLLIGFLLWMYQTNPDFLQKLGSNTKNIVNNTHEELSGENLYNEAAEIKDNKIKDPTNKGDIKVLKDAKVPGAAAEVAGKVSPTTGPSVLAGAEDAKGKIIAILGSYNAGIAGLFLVISSFFRGAKMGLFMVVGCGLILVGDLIFHVGGYVPTFNRLNTDNVGRTVGIVISVLGLIFGRQ